MMDLNGAHSLEDHLFVFVGVMTEHEAVTNLKRVSSPPLLFFDKLPGRRSQIVLRNLRVGPQSTIHVSRESADRNVFHVNRDHLDEQRLRITLIMHSAILIFLTA